MTTFNKPWGINILSVNEKLLVSRITHNIGQYLVPSEQRNTDTSAFNFMALSPASPLWKKVPITKCSFGAILNFLFNGIIQTIWVVFSMKMSRHVLANDAFKY